MGDESMRRRSAEQLAVLLKRPTALLWEKLADPSLSYVVLEYQAPLDLGETIAARHIQGIGLQPTPLRYYPAGALAAQTIGFVNLSNNGLYGIEQMYHASLNGETEDCKTAPAAPAKRISLGVRDLQPTARACDVILTLDWAIQDVVERELAAAIERTRSTSGTVIVAEPATGKILAMASLPSFDLNKFFESTDTLYNNPAISMDYEPGSVAKIMTMAAGLDTGMFVPSSTLIDSGEIIVGGFKIHNWDNKGHGRVNMTDVLAMSLNVGAAYISTSLGPAKFYDYAKRFGFAKRTGVDLANEISGQMRQPGMATWHISDLGTNSYGQGMTATPLQIVMMASTIANGGVLMKPYIVDAVVSQGEAHYTQPQAVRRAVSTDTARLLAGDDGRRRRERKRPGHDPDRPRRRQDGHRQHSESEDRKVRPDIHDRFLRGLGAVRRREVRDPGEAGQAPDHGLRLAGSRASIPGDRQKADDADGREPEARRRTLRAVDHHAAPR